MLLRRLRVHTVQEKIGIYLCEIGIHYVHEDKQKEKGPRELGQAIRTLARRAYHGMTTIELEYMAKDHYIDAFADEEMRRYVTLGRTKILDKAIEPTL